MRTRLRSYLRPNGIIELLPIKSIVSSQFPLRDDMGNLDELALSIKSRGLIEPIIVRSVNSNFEVIAGNRRYYAFKHLGIHEIPAIIIDASDKEAFEISLDENIHRKSLDPMEEAKAFKTYANKYGYGSITELANRIQKSEEYVSHRIILLTLPPTVQEQVSRRLLTASDAWEITRVKDKRSQEGLAKIAEEEKMTVKELRVVSKLLNEGVGADSLAAEILDSKVTGIENYNSKLFQDKHRKVTKAASTILRVALIRVDSLANGISDDEKALKSVLHELRIRIHEMIDQLYAGRLNEHVSNDPLVQIIRDVFLKNLNTNNPLATSKFYSKTFTVFDDLPPYKLLDLEQTIRQEVEFSGVLQESHCDIEQLRITRFSGGAVATFHFVYDLKFDEMICNWESRVTFVFERKDEMWSIIHEHWSPANIQGNPLEFLDKSIGLEKLIKPQNKDNTLAQEK
jgi:ParB family transcriptional regulator, chromosome partitioning protein